MKIKKGDQIIIISGKNKGKKSKVLYVFPNKEKIMAEGINLRKKHAKPKKEGEKGQIVEIPSPIHVSNVKLICSKCVKGVRLEYKIIKDKKNRICKKCKGVI